MKEKKYARYVAIFLLVAAILVFYKLFNNLPLIVHGIREIMSILRSFIYGAVGAFLLYPVTIILEGKIENTGNQKLIRKKKSTAIWITFIGALLILIIAFRFLIPLLIANTIEFIGKLNESRLMLIQYINQYITETAIASRLTGYLDNIDLVTWLNSFDLSTYISTATSSISEVFDILVGIVLVPYMLYEKENLREIFRNILSLILNDKAIKLIDTYITRSSIIFYNFIYGKAIDSLIIGIIALVFFIVFGYKFSIIFGVVIGVTNMIPYFGPYIGGIPVTAICLITDGFIPALMCGIFIVCLQLFDGFILGPHILGGQVGVRPFWIVFSITFFGGIMGVLGMFIGVPLIAICGMILNDLVAWNKRRKKKLQSTDNGGVL